MSEQKLHPKTSYNFNQDRIQALKAVLPEAFSDGRINWDALREILGEDSEDETSATEHFGLMWAGKREARKRASVPSVGTLIPMPGEGVNEHTTRNIFIEADNLEALKLLQKSYSGRIKMIYIDPPYNTGNDFVYNDDFKETEEDYLQRTGQINEAGKRLTSNPKSSGRFHANWLSMMYPRLRLARNLLREDGVIFVSIDDNEIHHLRIVMDEIFGSENFIATLVWQRSKKGDAKLIATTHEYIIVFAKDKSRQASDGYWRQRKEGVDEVLEQYRLYKNTYQNNHPQIREAMMKWYNSLKDEDPRKQHKHYNWSDDRGLYFAADFAGPDDGRASRPRYEIRHPVTEKPCKIPSTGWRWEEARTKQALSEVPPRIHFGIDETTIPCRKSYLLENAFEPFESVFYRDGRAATLELEKLVGAGLVDFPKNTDVLKKLIALCTDENSIVMDFFAGSGTTAQAVLELNQEDGGNRQFILVQIDEPTKAESKAQIAGYGVISQISLERIRQVIAKMEMERKEKLFEGNLDLGFKAFRFAPSNYKLWQDYMGESIEAVQDLFSNYATPLVDNWQQEHLLYEVLLLNGFPIDSYIEVLDHHTSNTVFFVRSEFHAHALFICLDKNIEKETVEQLNIGSDDVFVCLDTALTDEIKFYLHDSNNLYVI